jgi:hypothetical protein
MLAFLAGPAMSGKWDRPFIDEPEAPMPSSIRDREDWKEKSVTLPPWPKDSDLVEFHVEDSSPQFRQYIDGRHLSVGSDEVVRYTLVVQSRGGARNVSFEGLRCTPQGTFKIYAYGVDGRFEKTKSEWESLHGRSHDKIHRDLYRHFLCVRLNFEPRPKKDMIRTMRSAAPREANTGFMFD